MLTEKQCIELMFEKFPDFNSVWDEYQAYWQYDSPTLCIHMTAFTDYVIEKLQHDPLPIETLKNIFIFCEQLISDDNQTISDAVGTCFLENLINRSDRGHFSLFFIDLLGDKSKDYCKGWDEFCGVRTKGLWDDEQCSEWKKD